MKHVFTTLLTLISLFQWLPLKNGWAKETTPTTLQGIAFTDPEKVANKPEAWHQRPIQYRKKNIGADVTLMLDQHIYPAVLPLIHDYAKKNAIKVSVAEGTCGLSEGMLNRKEVDVGGFCCPPVRSDRLPGLQFHTLGISPLAIMVHPKNPTNNLTADQVRNIFRGKVTRWSQLSTSKKENFPQDQLIHPITRLHCKLRPGHWRLILDNEDLFGPRSSEVSTILDMVTRVINQPSAIGYEEIWTIKHTHTGKVKILKIDGQDPFDPESMSSGRYPFYRVHNITTRTTDNTANTKARELVRYLVKNAGKIKPEFYFTPAYKLSNSGWKFKEEELIGEP